MGRRSDHKLSQCRTDILIAVGLVLLTALTLARTVGNGFITLDDPTYVTQNEQVKGGLTFEGAKWAFTATRGANWHPLTWLSHMLDYSIYGDSPAGHHATNLLLHLANVILLYLVLRCMTGSAWKSGFVAALFAVHPLHVESVAWVAERKDVLSTLFWMLTMWAYVRYFEFKVQGSRFKVGAYALMIILFALGLMAKPMLVTLPFVLLLLDLWPLNRVGAKHLQETSSHSEGLPASALPLHPLPQLVEKIPLFALSILSSIITFVAQHKGGAVGPLDQMPLGIRVANAVVSYVAYIVKMLWPTRLIPFYPHPGEGLPVWQVIASAVVLVVLTAGAFWAAKRRPYIGVGWLWYIGTLVPVIGLIQVGSQAMADRYTYIPLIGLFVILAWGIPELVNGRMGEWERGRMGEWENGGKEERKNGRASVLPFLLSPILPLSVLLALAVCAFIQAGYWKDSFALFGRTLEVSPRNYVAHYNLGVALSQEGRLDDAYARFSEAVRIKPGYADAYHNLGVILQARGRIDDAIEQYRKAIEANPGLAQAHNNLAVMLFAKGDYAGAWHEVRQSQSYGFQPHPGFIAALSQKMPEPAD